MKMRPPQCEAHEAESCLCQTALALTSLFSKGDQDAPDALMAAYPSAINIVEAQKTFIDVMFPGKISATPVHADELGIYLTHRLSEGWRLLRHEIARAMPFRWLGQAARMEGAPAPVEVEAESFRIIQAFMHTLPEVRRLLIEDVRAAYEGDPAALTYAEVQIAYPGLLAIASHRLAHELYKLKVPIVPRVMSEWTHSQTGADIHPGAQIGHGFFIDHATGVVIGETTIIGNRVKLYQGVTLGARSFSLNAEGLPVKHLKRHPTVEDEVVIYAHATILGGDTVIGKGSTIGGNVFLMESVPPHSFVASKHPELHIREKGSVRT